MGVAEAPEGFRQRQFMGMEQRQQGAALPRCLVALGTRGVQESMVADKEAPLLPVLALPAHLLPCSGDN